MTTRVYVDIVGDLFHHGHVEFLRKAREFGDFLMVGVHSDDEIETYKRRPILSMEERIAVISACRYVDDVIPDAPVGVSYEWIERHDIHVIVHGDDMSDADQIEWYKTPVELGILRTVPYTLGISTTEIIDRCVRSRMPD